MTVARPIDLNLKPGDVVEVVKACSSYYVGMQYTVCCSENNPEASRERGYIWLEREGGWCSIDSVWLCRVVSRADEKIWEDRTRAEKGELLLACHEGEPIECFMSSLDGWLLEEDPLWLDDRAYRVRPKPKATPMIVPWESLADWINWVARDSNGEIWGYNKKPTLENLQWRPTGELCFSNLSGVKIEPGTCDWSDSLQQRPQKSVNELRYE